MQITSGFVIAALRTFNDILTAGIAITAFSLLVYAFSLNLRDRVTRAFAIILICVVIVFVGEALSSVAHNRIQIAFWMRVPVVGDYFSTFGLSAFFRCLAGYYRQTFTRLAAIIHSFGIFVLLFTFVNPTLQSVSR